MSPSDAVSALLDKRKAFVALPGETIAGTASLDGSVIRSVLVDPARQGRGIGRSLLDVFRAAAVSVGVGALRVTSSISAQSFYAALGDQRIRDEFYGAERTFIMEKPLAG